MRGSYRDGKHGRERPCGRSRQSCGAAEGQVQHEAGRLDHLSRCCAVSRCGDRRAARRASRGRCKQQQPKQHALLEQILVEGMLRRKASRVVLVKAGRIPGEGEAEAC